MSGYYKGDSLKKRKSKVKESKAYYYSYTYNTHYVRIIYIRVRKFKKGNKIER